MCHIVDDCRMPRSWKWELGRILVTTALLCSVTALVATVAAPLFAAASTPTTAAIYTAAFSVALIISGYGLVALISALFARKEYLN